ncbi:MAG: amino acid adenylation domain-containing protein [Candidatus Sulfotelmatobacter sp.]
MAETLTTSEQKRKLLEQYLQQRAQSASAPATIPRRPPGAAIPLSFAQQQVWLHARLAPELPLYNEPFTVHRKGPLDEKALERSLNEIIRRHEAWRTTFAVVDGEPVQVVHPPFELNLPVADLRNLPESDRIAAALRLASEDARRPFDLAKLPLVRAQLIRLAGEEYRLYLSCHHLIFDGIAGYQVFLPELVGLYRIFASQEISFFEASGEISSLPDPPFQYGDYAVWQRQAAGREPSHPHLEYWRKKLGGALPVLQLPTDRPGRGAESFGGAMQGFALSRELSDGLRALSRQQGVTLFMSLLAALDTLLYRYTGQEDILVGSITAGRNHPGTEKLLGFFLNTVVLRNDLAGDPTFCELLERVRQTTVEALSNDDVPLDLVLRELQPARELSRNPWFRVLLSLEPPLGQVEPGWNLTPIDVETGTAKFDLCFVLDDRSEGLTGRLLYSTDLFDAETIAGLVECWQRLLQSVVASPAERISELQILPERERHRLLIEFNASRRSYPLTLVHQRFEAQAANTPQGVAVKCGDQQLTYRALDQRANQLAHHLKSLGVGPEIPVALGVERSVVMLVGILGVLKAGGAYVPLDPAYPPERLNFMLDDCGAEVLLMQSHLPQLMPSRKLRTVRWDQDWTAIDRQPAHAPLVEIASDNLAYVIYTSGSAGGPKGVEITQRNLAQSTSARLDYYEGAGNKFLLLSSFAFDSSVATIFHALCSGGTLVLPGPEFTWEARQIAGLISENQISNILAIPSVYGELLQSEGADRLASLRTVVLAGESCPAPLTQMHFQKLPSVQLFNEYGPTEATVWSTVYRCEPGSRSLAVPIGRPIANTQLYALDRNRQLLPRGVPGELYIAGDGVARGYRNRPELTAEKFPSLRLTDQTLRMYRTGDSVRYLPDGNLSFLGRLDEQVKIRGMRIELGEIENALSAHPDVREAAVSVEDEQHLVAYVVAREEFATSGAELGALLKSRLPQHMVPSAFHFLSALPRTPNGKLDRRALGSTDPDRLDMGRDLDSWTRTANDSLPEAVSPPDSIEARLLPIWQEVLGTASFDVTQNFFQLGGHSLLAAKLLYRIEREFKQPLTLAFIFQAPTIELMADWLRHPDQSLRARTIVEIQPEGSQLPLFWVRATPRFRLLAQKLGPDQPLLGLDIPFADATKLPTPYRIEDIASFLIKAMREAQPHGPYSLAGLCVNAVIAYDMAVQLNAQGEEIALLALLDGHNQAYYKNPLRDGRYTGRIKYHLSNIVRSDLRGGSAYILNRFEEARRKLERTIWQLSFDQGRNGKAGKMHNADAVVHPAFHRYEPQPYSGTLVMLQSSEWPQGDYFDFTLGWKDLVRDGIEFHRIPGNHPAMFTEPNVNLVAEKLRNCLLRARTDRSAEAREAIPAGSKERSPERTLNL